jgi:hypothetical protein
MALELSTLDIDKLIVHTVPAPGRARSGGSPDGPQVHGALSPLGPDELNFVRIRILRALNESSFPAMFVEQEPHTLRDHIEALTSEDPSDDQIIATSQAMAYELFAGQPGTASDGLLIVATASVSGLQTCVVLKLEQEVGVRTEEETIDGQIAIRLIIEENLIWTENTKVFKTGLFAQNEDGSYEIVVADVQTGHGVADYWRKYLGCTYLQTPDQATQLFYEESVKWINNHVSNPERRNQYVRALHTELNSNRTTFWPRQFARDHLVGPDRNRYLDGITEEGVSASRTRKDVSRVEPALRRLRVKLDGIDITADASAIGRVEVVNLTGGQTQVIATGELKKISGSGR